MSLVALLDVSEIEDLDEKVDLELNEDQEDELLESELGVTALLLLSDLVLELDVDFSTHVLDVLVEELSVERVLEVLQIFSVDPEDLLLGV